MNITVISHIINTILDKDKRFCKEVEKLLLRLDFQSEIPIYVQLRNQIIEGMATGKLKRGEALPSVRQLASDLGINLHTVNKAYNILKQDGFIVIHRQKGVAVNPEMMSEVTGEYTSRLAEELRPAISEAICRGMSEKQFKEVIGQVFESIRKGGSNL